VRVHLPAPCDAALNPLICSTIREPEALFACSPPRRCAARSVELAACCAAITHRCFYPTPAATSPSGPSAPSAFMDSPSRAMCAGGGAMPHALEWACWVCAPQNLTRESFLSSLCFSSSPCASPSLFSVCAHSFPVSLDFTDTSADTFPTSGHAPT